MQGDADLPAGVEPIIPAPRAAFDVVAVASSAGGVTALKTVLSGLPADFPAAVVIVQHLDPRHKSLLADILGRHTPLDTVIATNEGKLRPRSVFVAPPDSHLLVNAGGSMSLSHTALVHFVRPSADLLFESVAAAYGDRAIAVVLTGSGVDGALGVEAVKKMGGTVVAQDEATSEFFSMPEASIKTGCVDFVLPVDEIAGALVRLVVQEVTDG